MRTSINNIITTADWLIGKDINRSKPIDYLGGLSVNELDQNSLETFESFVLKCERCGIWNRTSETFRVSGKLTCEKCFNEGRE